MPTQEELIEKLKASLKKDGLFRHGNPHSIDSGCYKGYAILSKDKLEKLSLERILALMKSVRAVRSAVGRTLGHRCCEICHEYVGDDWQKDVGQYLDMHDAYFELLKSYTIGRGDKRTRVKKRKRK